MKHLHIEWRRYTKAGSTCDRCSKTGSSLNTVVELLRDELGARGISVTLTETEVPAEEISRSNSILFNGKPLEDLLSGASAGESNCPSCSCLTGSTAACRTIEYGGTTHEDIPPELIRAAALRAVGLAD